MVNPRSVLFIGLAWSLQILCVTGQRTGPEVCPQYYHLINIPKNVVCLRFFSEPATWQHASNICQEDYATLLQFDNGNTKEQIDLFKQTLNDAEKIGSIWLALRRLNDYFQWVGSSPRILKSVSAAPKPPWGSVWDPNEPRLWDGCVALSLFSGNMTAQNCTTDREAFICQRKPLREELYPVISCDAEDGWLGHDAFRGCFRAGTEPSTWKEANQACVDEQAELVVANRPFYSAYFRIATTSSLAEPLNSWVFKYVDCEEESDVNCTSARWPYLCFKRSNVRNIRVQLTMEGDQQSNTAIWTTNATKTRPSLKCDITMDGKQISRSYSESIQFMWSRNGVYLDRVKNPQITPAHWSINAPFPVDEKHTLYVVLGTYQCNARLPGVEYTYSSNVVNIFMQDLHMFSYTINLKVPSTVHLPDLEPTSCPATQTRNLITEVTKVLNTVLPLQDPQTNGFDEFRWSIHSVRPRMPEAWKVSTEHFITFKVYVGANVSSDPLATLKDTWKKLQTRIGANKNVEMQVLERCDDKEIDVGETKYTLQMLPRTPEVFSDPSCVTYESFGENVPSTCLLSYLDGPRWKLLNYTTCLHGQAQTSCPAGLWKVSEELCVADFSDEALSWEDAKNKCQSLNSHLLHPTVKMTEAWPKPNEPMVSWMAVRQNFLVVFDRFAELPFEEERNDKTTVNESCVYVNWNPSGGWRPRWGESFRRKDCSSAMPFSCIRRSLPQSLWDVPWCPKRWLGTHQKSFKNSCFYIHWLQDTTLDEARRSCTAMGSHLVILNRPEAVDAVRLTFKQQSEELRLEGPGYWTALEKKPTGLFFWTVSSGQAKSELAKISVSNVTGGDSIAFYPNSPNVARIPDKTVRPNMDNTGASSWRAVEKDHKLGFICEKLNVGNVARKTRVNLFRNPHIENDDLERHSITCEGLDVHKGSKVYWYRNSLIMPFLMIEEEDFFEESSTLRQTARIDHEGDYWCEIWSLEPYYPVRSNSLTIAASSDDNYHYVINLQTAVSNRSAILALQQMATYEIFRYVQVDGITKVFRGNDLVEFYGNIDARKLLIKRSVENFNQVQATLRELQQGMINRGLNGEVRFTAGCFSQNTTSKGNQNLTWPYTSVGRTTLPLQLCVSASGAAVTRKCMGSFQYGAFWGPVTGSCDELAGSITKSLYKLSQSNITKDSATKTAGDLHQLTKDTGQLQPIDITYIATTMQRIAETGSVNLETLQHVASTVDHLMLVVEIEKLSEAHATTQSSSSITQSLEKMLNTVDLGPDRSFNLSLPSLYVETQILTAETIRGDLVVGVASLQEDTFNSSRVIRVKEDMDFNFTKTDAALLLPQDFVRKRTKTTGASNSTQLSFIIYKDSRLFMGDQTRMSKVVSRVVAASLSGLPVTRLDPPVKLLFRPLQSVRSLDNASCVFWDARLASGLGDWSDAGCWPYTTHNGLIVCHCNHLTNFAVLMDVYGQDERVTGHHKFALDIITYVGCALSILGLSLTILTFLTFKKWRKNNGSKVLCNLAVSLLCVLVVFLGGIEQTEWQGLCLVVAALLHYFVLTSFCWMLIEAVHQYLLFVRVLDTYIPKFILKAMLFAWGTPLAFVITILAIDVNLYRGGEHYCWMSLDAIYYTFLLPIGIIVAINAIVFILVLKGITCDRQSALRSNQSKRQLAMAQLHASACIFVLLGLTWIFGFLAISSARIVFQYLFCICNSLQGLLIFLFMIVRERNAKELWFLICFRKQADSSGLSTSTTKKKQSKLEEHNFSENCTASTKLAANNSRYSTNTVLTT